MGAPAARAYELSKIWKDRGHQVTIVTGVPNHPTGVLYEGYKNKLFQREVIDGIEVIRVYVLLAPNKGFFRRTLNYLSFMITSFLAAMRLKPVRYDVVLATSPQFFNAVSGYLVSKIRQRPFIFEVRDLWPESIVAVGALKNNRIIRLLEGIEWFLYKNARHIVAAVEGIRTNLTERGIPPEKISLVPNGVDLEMFRPRSKAGAVCDQYGLQDHFVVSYIGTHGMAHALDQVLLAADRLKNEKIFFLFIGEGAEKDKLIRIKQEMGLDHVHFIGRQPRERIPLFIAASDACLASLSRTDFFAYALPSKLFEFMACARPIILSAKGASRQLIESAQCGIGVEPEQPEALAEAILKLYRDRSLGEQLGRNGRRFAASNMDRMKSAIKYERILERVVRSSASLPRA